MPSADPRPRTAPATPFPAAPGELHTSGRWLWIPLKNEWRDVSAKPEEIVRQGYIRHLVEYYGYALGCMDQERRTMHGRNSPRGDIAVWETPQAKTEGRSPQFVVECKADSVPVKLKDYFQGESYTRAAGAGVFVAHNKRYTGVFRLVPGMPGEFVEINELPRSSDWGDAAKLKEVLERLQAFNRKEFQDLLFECHTILRDVHKMDPGRAFDTMSKILFIKMYIERSGLHGTFTVDYLDRRASTRLPTDPEVHDGLFAQTKKYYEADELFSDDERLEISEATFRRIVKKLERFDLAKTGEDVKGLAFEKFLGATFRGNLGQYFTPRPIVNFMVDLLDPAENEYICDPAAGSGGFLIKSFEHVRSKIEADIDAAKDVERAKIVGDGLPEDEAAQAIEEAYERLNVQLMPSDEDGRPVDTRVGRLAWLHVFGCDAEPRAARTAKMNMIMHGDGHGGIHFHDGLLDINGIFEERFDVVMTNPPFGSNVGEDQVIGDSEVTRVPSDKAYRQEGEAKYGPSWLVRHDAMVKAAASRSKILDGFEVGKDRTNRPTEILFLERCIRLLHPGGRMGIVLPDGNLNNPSLDWLRRWAEGKARLMAIVSLPPETFRSSDATVKASVIFLRRFTDADTSAWQDVWAAAHAAVDPAFSRARSDLLDERREVLLTGNLPAAVVALNAIEGAGNPIPSGSVELAWHSLDQGSMKSIPKLHGEDVGRARASAPKLWKALDKATGSSTGRAALKAARGAFLKDLHSIDLEHSAAIWAAVREAFDYPVFAAAPATVGITSTGDTGDNVANDLPEVLDAYRKYTSWVDAGGIETDRPAFA
jgi:type I restriction enzyme M protein